MKRKPPIRQCDYPGCQHKDQYVKRVDISTNCFRGDDIVMNGCKEHRRPEHHGVLLQTEKAKKQL